MTARRFYTILCAGSAVLALLFSCARPLWCGAAFCAAFAVCTGGMRLLLWLSDRTSGLLRRLCRGLYAVGTVLFALFLLTFVIVQIVIARNARTDPESYQAQYILVLGGGILDDQPTQTLRLRLEAAQECLERNPDGTLIVCGGQGKDEDYSEAYVMRQWLLEHGVPEDRILVEDRSLNTVQNIANARKILDQQSPDGYTTAAVSSGFHLFRVRHLMKQAGLDPYAIAAPSTWYMRPLFCLREYFSLVILAATGRW